MIKLSNFTTYLFFTVSYLLSEMAIPSNSNALGGAYIWAFEKAIPTSLILMIIFLLCLNLFKKPRPQFPIQLILVVFLFFVFLVISFTVYLQYQLRYIEPKFRLIAAAELGEITLFTELLDQGMDPNVTIGGRNALCEVAWRGNVEKAKLLLNRGANIEIRNKDGETPLITAATGGHEEMVTFLLNNKANIEAKDNEGKTALMSAVILRHPEIVQILLTAGANVNARNNSGETALMEAALRGRTESIPLLLSNGADINAQDNEGRTALYDSVWCCFPETTQMLLEQGADMNIKSNKGCSAKDLATRSGKPEIANLFK